MNFIKGQEDPEIQGWYSVEYNKFEPNTVSVLSTGIESNEVFVWLLVPFESIAPELNVSEYQTGDHGVSLKISDPDKGVL